MCVLLSKNAINLVPKYPFDKERERKKKNMHMSWLSPTKMFYCFPRNKECAARDFDELALVTVEEQPGEIL